MEHQKSKKLGEIPIPKLLAQMSIPAIISMLVQALYNVVDTIFVSRISGAATTALSLAFPIQMLLLAFSLGIGIGSNSAISRRLGEGRIDDANQTAKHGFFMAIIISVFFAAAGYPIAKIFITAYINGGAYENSQMVLTYGIQYLAIVSCLSFGMHLEILGTKTLQATGNMVVPMISQLIGAIINIILDPIMIFGLLGFPRLEVIGAAIATVIGQCCAMVFTYIMLHRNRETINISLRDFKPKKQYFTEILKVGIPVTIMNSVASVTVASLNAILNGLNTIGIAVMGIYFKLQSFVFMPVFGLCQGAMPILGYNYGARNKKRFEHTVYLSTGISLIILSVGLLIFLFLPEQMISLFKSDANESFYAEMLSMGVVAFKIVCTAFIPAAFSIIMITMFQAMGRGSISMIISLFRQILLLIPLAYILGEAIGIEGVWWSYPIAELVTLICFMPAALNAIKKGFAPIPREIKV